MRTLLPPRSGFILAALLAVTQLGDAPRRDDGAQSRARVSSPAQPVPPAQPATLSLGTTLDGSLEAGDRSLPGGTLADDFAVELAAGRRVGFMVRAEDPGAMVDAVLLRDGRVVAGDEEGAGSGEREVRYTPASAGRFVLRVWGPRPEGVRTRYMLQAFAAN